MSSTLGKRKHREGEITPHGSTLFVSNLPYTATSVDLQTLFSDIAPIRTAFVVTEHGTGVSKGVGYVSFAIKEDAQSAHDKITKEGITLVGRSLRIQWAENKPKEKADVIATESKSKPKPPRPPRPSQSRSPQDPLAIRTIVVSGLPSSIDSNTLWKKIRKYNGAEKVDWPIKMASGDEDPTTAHVLFKTPAAASEAVTKLHAHVFKGSLLSVMLKKRLDTLFKPVPSGSSGPALEGQQPIKAAPNHANRLIVRNLPFEATEQDLRAVFLPYGPVYSITIPKGEKVGDGEGKERTKGFAFVWMLSKKDAEKAIEGCNGLVVRAGTADSMVSDKQKKKKQRREEKRLKAVAKDEGTGDADELVEDKRAIERTIAVDWALSKEKWIEEKAKIEEAVEDVDMEEGASSSQDGVEDSDQESEHSDSEEELGVHNDESGDSDDDDDENKDEDEDMEEPVKPTLPPPETGTTLFVRNVPFQATEDELRTLFRAFGPLRYARITIDPVTGRSRGTGFACFWNKEDADKVVEQSDILRMETTGNPAPKKNPFIMPSILTPDPSSMLAQNLVLHGRTLDVVRAVTRDEAGKLKEAGEKIRQKADKRNMYLLREGVILPNSPDAERLTPVEVERRTASFNARRALLKTNPSLFISKTRLSVRQIPIFATERLLKRLAIHAIRIFEKEVKEGERPGLTADELSVVVDQPDGDENQEVGKDGGKKKKKFTGRGTRVKQAKIVRQLERVDPITGKGKSKGYGFIELNTHGDALRVLRWANNNPDVGPLLEEWWKEELRDLIKLEKGKETRDDARLKRMQDELEKVTTIGAKKSKGSLIVEFSIENVQVVKRRNALQHNALPDSKTPKGLPPPENKAEERPPKKRRVPKDEATPVKMGTAKPGSKIGSLIGRKRKMRKGGGL